jgi:hypothetical protein
MKFSGRALVLCLLLSACSLPVQTGSNLPMLKAASPSRLLQIQITSWGTPRYTGLLGLQFHDSGLTYMLLDATGIKLLESQVSQDGDSTITQAAGKLRESGLPEFLSSSLRKIYLIMPATEPCADTLLLHFCAEMTNGRLVRKHAAAGPFTLWEASYDGADSPAVSFSEPWFGVSITLASLKQPQ